jgi:hypothetical protein
VFVEQAGTLTGSSAAILHQFDLGRESNFATWVSASLLFLNGLLAAQLATIYKPIRQYAGLLMAALAVGLILLAVDDLLMVHERVEKLAAKLLTHAADFPGDTKQENSRAWRQAIGPLFPLGLAAVLAAVFAGPFKGVFLRRNLPYLVACVLLVCVAAVSEFAYKTLGCSEDWCFRTEIVFEEGGELAAILLFMIFLFRECRRE